MDSIDIAIYTTVDGSAPFSEWINALRDIKGRAVIRARINHIRLGNFGDCKTVGKGILELRVNFGPGYRVYLAKRDPALIVLLIGGDKGTQAKDIKKAQRF